MSEKNIPLVSFCLLTYNQSEYVEEALRSAFAQTYDNLEIIISDDCSTDLTQSIIKKMINNYNGSHRIIVNFNAVNLGIRENVNKVLYDLSNGDIIMMAAGDDVSMPNRTDEYVKYFNRFPEVVSASCISEEVDSHMNTLDTSMEWSGEFSIFTLDDYIEFRNFIIYSGDSRAIRRCVVEKFPKLKYPAAEDIYLFIRSLLIGSGIIIRKPLVRRRHHINNASSEKISMRQIIAHKKQVDDDIEYAYKQGYISGKKKILMLNKDSHIREIYSIYMMPYLFNIKSLFYHVLSKVFHVRKY